jgi:hypothetical protein
VAVGQEANVCATNALARAAVGRRVFGAGAGEGAREFKEMVEELMQLAGVFNIGDFVPARVRRRLRLGSRPPHGIASSRPREWRRDFSFSSITTRETFHG